MSRCFQVLAQLMHLIDFTSCSHLVRSRECGHVSFLLSNKLEN